jgi:hypothetical protein
MMSLLTLRGGTITSALTTFLSGITGMFAILVLEAAIPSSVVWRTLHCELPADMILQKKFKHFAKKITSIKLVPTSPKIFGILTAVK